jgi:hypothetical protein
MSPGTAAGHELQGRYNDLEFVRTAAYPDTAQADAAVRCACGLTPYQRLNAVLNVNGLP